VFGVQIAAALGCQVVLTSSSNEKLARGRELGATHGVNYAADPEWEKAVWQITGGKGVDHVLEVGGGGTLGKSLACVAPGGHIALIGVLTGFGPPQDSLFPLVGKNATLSGIYVGSRAHFRAMNEFLTANQIRPVIDRVFGFDDTGEAFTYMEAGKHFGKVVVRI
jgi:NADPH:quinone reductase-like Zn-dependent oxidoreductase